MQENTYICVIFTSFWRFSMKNFAEVKCLHFGSAGAHTYPKSGKFHLLP